MDWIELASVSTSGITIGTEGSVLFLRVRTANGKYYADLSNPSASLSTPPINASGELRARYVGTTTSSAVQTFTTEGKNSLSISINRRQLTGTLYLDGKAKEVPTHSIYENVGGAEALVESVWENVNGVWTEINSIWENINGVWTEIGTLGYRNIMVQTGITNAYLNENTGQAISEPDYRLTDYLQVKGSHSYIFSSSEIGKQFVYTRTVYYDINKSYLSGEFRVGMYDTYTSTAPPNAKYMRVCSDIAQPASALPETWQIIEQPL